ncbi:MAG: FitA-like ribbon-helix-helix domain-containing protein [Dermatophilaceae bacterium]
MSKVIQVRDVPDDVHDRLTARARSAGLSLNQFVLREYERIARQPTNAEILRRLAELPGDRPTEQQIVDSIREYRDRDE